MVNSRVLLAQGEVDGTAVSVANVSYFFACGYNSNLTNADVTANEANTQVLQKNAGVFSDLSFSLTANGVAATSTMRFRINGVDANMTISIPSSTTGNFSLATPNATVDTVVAGDKTNLHYTPGASTGTITMRTMKTLFLNTSSNETITRLGVGGFPTTAYNTASAVLFEPIAGEAQGSDVTNEAAAKCRIRKAGTVRNAAIFVTANARSTSNTIVIRKTGAASGITITVAAGATGYFEDTTHTATVAVADDLNWQITVGTGTGAFSVSMLLCDYATTDGWFPIINAESDAGNQATNLTRFTSIGGYRDVFTTETSVDTLVSSAFTFAELTCNVFTNANAGICTVTVMNNTVATALTVSTVASTTNAALTDSVHTFNTVAADRLDHKIVTSASAGALGIRSITIWGQEIVVPQTVMVEWEEM